MFSDARHRDCTVAFRAPTSVFSPERRRLSSGDRDRLSGNACETFFLTDKGGVPHQYLAISADTCRLRRGCRAGMQAPGPVTTSPDSPPRTLPTRNGCGQVGGCSPGSNGTRLPGYRSLAPRHLRGWVIYLLRLGPSEWNTRRDECRCRSVGRRVSAN